MDLKRLFSLRLLKYFIIFLLFSFFNNYCIHIFKKNIATPQFDGQVNLGPINLDKSQICMIIIGLIATFIYNTCHIELLFDSIYNKIRGNSNN